MNSTPNFGLAWVNLIKLLCWHKNIPQANFLTSHGNNGTSIGQKFLVANTLCHHFYFLPKKRKGIFLNLKFEEHGYLFGQNNDVLGVRKCWWLWGGVWVGLGLFGGGAVGYGGEGFGGWLGFS